jgi:hypothetical protein
MPAQVPNQIVFGEAETQIVVTQNTFRPMIMHTKKHK